MRWSFASCGQHPVPATMVEASERIDARVRGKAVR